VPDADGGRCEGIEPTSPDAGVDMPVVVGDRDLPLCMHPGIGAARTCAGEWYTGVHPGEGMLDGPLQGAHSFLPLPAVKIGAVVGDENSEPWHGARVVGRWRRVSIAGAGMQDRPVVSVRRGKTAGTRPLDTRSGPLLACRKRLVILQNTAFP